jgi:thioredoxin reductase (NADPH)
VLDHAAADANPPRLWLAEATKEELLARWMLALRTARPPIREGRRVIGVIAEPDGTWTVESADASVAAAVDASNAARTGTALDAAGAERHRARKVVLAVGRRGSPRTLPIDVPPAMAAHVHYALADAASFAGQRVIVVGLGDVAMEAAIALSRQPGTRVTIAHRSEGFRRGRARNLDELRRRIAAGAVQLQWRTEVAALQPGRASLRTPAGLVDEPCDSLFVLIGAEPGGDLLARLTTPVQLPQTDAGHHALAPVGPAQHPGDRGEEAPP